MKLTKAQHRALNIVKKNPGITPSAFAKLMWPDSKCWNHSVKCGPKGSTRGGGMPLAAGGYLGRLYRAGLIELGFSRIGQSKYYISGLGLSLLSSSSQDGT